MLVLTDASARNWILKGIDKLFSKIGMQSLSTCLHVELSYIADKLDQLPAALEVLIPDITQRVRSDVENLLRDYRVHLNNPEVVTECEFTYVFAESRHIVDEHARNARTAAKQLEEFKTKMMMYEHSQSQMHQHEQVISSPIPQTSVLENERQTRQAQEDPFLSDQQNIAKRHKSSQNPDPALKCIADGCNKVRNFENGRLFSYCSLECAEARNEVKRNANEIVDLTRQEKLPVVSHDVTNLISTLSSGSAIDEEFNRNNHWYVNDVNGYFLQDDLTDVLLGMSGTTRANNTIPLSLVPSLMKSNEESQKKAKDIALYVKPGRGKIRVLPDSSTVSKAIKQLTTTKRFVKAARPNFGRGKQESPPASQ